jgi:hypothetical protein
MRELIHDLAGRLLTGSHPALAILRDQFALAHVTGVTLTGAGFYAHFDVPAEIPRIEPRRAIGGNVPMQVDGLENGAGCLLCVTDGRLDFLEGYTFDGEWPERPVILSFGETRPLEIHAPAT